MYAGTTIRHSSGRFVGVHQKIDRSARRYLKHYLPKSIAFPDIKTILHFEGANGPDGVKRKGPSSTQPWHFIDPDNLDDRELIDVINNHMTNLTASLKSNDQIRAAFEAAWLAHAIVDGLTPAHHYPLGDKIEELWGKSHDERNSILEKNFVKGDGLRDTLAKNWEYWGAGGVWTAHSIFEMGAASAVAAESFRSIGVSRKDINQLRKVGFNNIFLQAMNHVDSLGLYEAVANGGWNSKLARIVKEDLVPNMIRVVMLAWYQAAIGSMDESR